MVGRVRTTIQRLEAMTFQDVQGRLAYELIILAETYGKEIKEGVEIDLPLTQLELATQIGTTRESVNKAMGVLRSKDLISFEGAQILIKEPAELKKFVWDRGR